MSSQVSAKPHLMIQIPEENPIELGSPLGNGANGTIYKYNSPKGSALAVKLHGSQSLANSQKEAEMYKSIQGVSQYTIGFRRDGMLSAMGKKGDTALQPCQKQHVLFLKRLPCPNFDASFPLCQATPFRCNDVFHYARQAAFELDIYHRIGKIAHRDLTRGNIAIDRTEKRIIFFDLGSAERIDKMKPTDLVTARWCRSPEAMFLLSCDATMDLWALGCLLFEFYTGDALFPSGGGDLTPRGIHFDPIVLYTHLALICFQIGPPPKEFIQKLPSNVRESFFVRNSNGEYELNKLVYSKHTRVPKIKWRDMIYHTAQVKGDSKENADILIRLMESVLKYTGRVDAQGFLQLMDGLLKNSNAEKIAQ